MRRRFDGTRAPKCRISGFRWQSENCWILKSCLLCINCPKSFSWTTIYLLYVKCFCFSLLYTSSPSPNIFLSWCRIEEELASSYFPIVFYCCCVHKKFKPEITIYLGVFMIITYTVAVVGTFRNSMPVDIVSVDHCFWTLTISRCVDFNSKDSQASMLVLMVADI